MNFLVAVQLLTSFPVAVRAKLGPDRLGKATAWFPVVGLLMGLVLAGLNWVLAWVLPPLLINALLVAALGIIVCEAAARTLNEMATFAEAGVSEGE